MRALIKLIILLAIIYNVGHYFFVALGFITEKEDTKIQIQQEEWQRQQREYRHNEQKPPVLYEPELEHQMVSFTCPYCDGKGVVKVTIPPPPNYSGDPDHYKKYTYETVEQTCSHCGGAGVIIR